ncbi:MAG: phosphate ABC transporter permease subunit PstC [Deltaproteobacteria bacterium]|nr:phosphate ABC transporter permease subunit PstC [Deltaproteobacteria bacterium]
MPLLKTNSSSLWQSDRLLAVTLKSCGVATGLIVFLIIGFLIAEAIPVLKTTGISRFFTDPGWYPSSNQFNLTPMLWGSLYAMVGSVLLATPLGIFSAVFCHYYAPPLVAKIYRMFIQLLSGIPSVVYGFWGLVVLVPKINEIAPPGTSLLAGILILAIMILPTIMLTADASLSNVPAQYLRGAAALGLSRSATIRGVVFPAARSGLFTGVILETGRAIGETMAILMVCGNIVKTPTSLFEPMRTLTANIALEMAYAMGNHRSALFVSGVVLMLFIISLVVIAEIISSKAVYE